MKSNNSNDWEYKDMDSDSSYNMLRNITSPIVAITSSYQNEINGMIANSAIRASLLPEYPRLAFYCFKQHHSHELIENSGKFCLHMLQRNQLNVVNKLGFESGSQNDKLSKLHYNKNNRQMPVIKNSYSYFDCDVINAMDAGPATFYLGEAVELKRNPHWNELTLMDSQYYRNHAPKHLLEEYKQNKKTIQEWARSNVEVDSTYKWNPPEE